MTADKFIEIIRKGSDKLRVDDILLQTPDREVHGKGMLRIEHERIEIDFTINRGESLPHVGGGVFTTSDFWKLSGVIEDHLHFKCNHVGPGGSQHWFNGLTTITFSLNPIELTLSGWDAMSRAERKSRWQQAAAAATGKAQADNECSDEPETPVCVSFHARLASYSLLGAHSVTKTQSNNPFLGILNSSKGDTIVGEIDGYDFALINDEGDAHLHMRSKKDYDSPGQQEDWDRFRSLLNALAFIHGMHAWPFRVEYWRDGTKIADKVTAAQRLPRTSHAPFNEALAVTSLGGSLDWKVEDVLKAASTFFSAKTPLRDAVLRILHLFREAGDEGTAFDITTLALCTLFEALVRVIFKELGLKKSLQETESIKLFENAKKQVLADIAPKVAQETAPTHPGDLDGGYRRLHRVLSSAQSFSPREMLHAVVGHLGLQWENDWGMIFETWKNARHPLVHEARAGETEVELKQSTISESRIGGAINILVLKLMGYSGPIRASAFEDAYRRI